MQNNPSSKIETTKKEPCEACGSIKDVSFTADPYASEIHGDDTQYWLCADCCYNSAMDI
jgi:hypothetical protein